MRNRQRSVDPCRWTEPVPSDSGTGVSAWRRRTSTRIERIKRDVDAQRAEARAVALLDFDSLLGPAK
jgi:hypothetical protein